MLVYPELQELCTFMDSSAMSNKFTDPYLEFVKKRVRNLRNTAMRAGMLPTTEEEIKKVDKKELAKQFGAFAEDIRLRLV
jgi:hypothetical protein